MKNRLNMLKKNSRTEYDPLKMFINIAKQQPILTQQEELFLLKKYKKDSSYSAFNTLMMTHLKLVLKIAIKYYRQYRLNLFDLIQEGSLGMAIAIEKFNILKNVRFSTYAVFWIRAYILKYLKDNFCLIRMDLNKSEKRFWNSIHQAKDKLKRKGVDPDNYSRLAETLNVDRQKIVEMYSRVNIKVVSLDHPVSDDSNDTYIDLVKADNIDLEKDFIEKDLDDNLKTMLYDFYKRLDWREKMIWRKRIMAENPESLYALGDILSISRERVRQLESRIKAKLQLYLERRDDFVVSDFI